MFWFFIRVRALLRLGLGRPFRFAALLLLIGCLIAGLVYSFVIFRALNGRSATPHVIPDSSH